MADKLDGNAIIANTIPANRIQTGSITSTQLQTSLYNTVTSATHPKIRSISYPGNDTAANTGGGDTVTLTGTGFGNTGNVQIYINGNVVSSITVTNANSISFTAPALAAATYPVYLINTSDGSTAILIPGIQYSGTPSWSTSTPLTSQDATGTWNIQLVATSDSAVSYSLQAGSSLPAGITLAANGLISGTMTSPPSDETTYNFTVVANDLENQDASRAFSVTVTVAVLDPYFTYTTLLLHGDGTNNANNHAFVDSSNNAFAITRNGNATQGTFSPFGDNWSVYGDGNGDYLSLPSSSNWAFGTGDFTIEAWIYWPSAQYDTVFNYIIGNNNSNDDSTWGFGIGYSSKKLSFSNWNYNLIIGNAMVPHDQWVHVALTRSSGTLRTFINGVFDNSASDSTNLSGTTALHILKTQYTGLRGFTGYVSNARIVKGTALYTSSFTPSTTPLSVVANTVLLTCQSNAYLDKGPSRLAVTRNGDTRVSKFDPFKPYKAIPASYGVYFDGTGDYLSVADGSWITLGANDFTAEAWIYNTVSTGASQYICGQGNSAGQAASVSFELYLTASRTLSGGIYIGSQKYATSTGTVPLNTWTHVALVRDGGNIRLYINGVQDGVNTTAGSSSVTDQSSQFSLARGGEYNGLYFNGHMSNFRFIKGTCLYPSGTTFTPPTSPLTAVANTQLLTCQSTTIIDNSTNALTITSNGDARPTDLNPFTTTFVSEKYNTANGGGSLYCDGSGDSVFIANNTVFDMGSGNFTIEGWCYRTSTSPTYGAVCTKYEAGGASWWVGFNGTNWDVYTYYGAGSALTIYTGAAPALYQWINFALERNGSNIEFYVNGVRVAQVGAQTMRTTAANVAIGSGGTGYIAPYEFPGYISNIRIIKGNALYSGAYVPSITPVTNIANTSLLCNFTNAGILDSVGKNVLETVGDARVNTSVKKYGTGSMYFDGTGDYLVNYSSVTQDAMTFATGDFTIECWVYFNSTSGQQGIIDVAGSPSSGASGRWNVNYNSGNLNFGNHAVGNILAVPFTPVTGTWYHIAFTRASSTVRGFINGVLGGSATSSVSFSSDGVQIGIGASFSAFNGHIDDLRITKGVARYRYNFTPPIKAFSDGDGNLANNTTDVLVGDQVNLPVFPYTTLLLHGDGTNNANNHAFVDSSNNAFAITRNGNATQGTFSPFSPTGWSAYFDGTGDYLTAPNNAALQFGTGDFTVEAWVFINSAPASDARVYSYQVIGSTSVVIKVAIDSNRKLACFLRGTGGSGATTYTSSSTIPIGQWTHIAFTRSGTNGRIFVNGLLDQTQTGQSQDLTAAVSAYVGTLDGSSDMFTGYISNIRVVKGTAVYTDSFTPSTTPLTAISGTSLLTCQSNRFIDNSTNAFTITRNGDTSIQAFSPFAPSVEYTANTHGGSAYFDGTGDYLSLTSNTAFDGSSTWSVEFWVYPTYSSGNDKAIIGNMNPISYPTNYPGWDFIAATPSTVAFRWGYPNYTDSGAIAYIPYAWNHLAVSISGGRLSFYINGTRVYTTTTNTNISASTAAMYIGWSPLNNSVFNGYIAHPRITKGSTPYDPTLTTLTVPTSPVTAIANTQLLCNFTNAGILDSTGKNVLETVGDAKVNTATKKYGTGSMYFDGTGDWLLTRASPNLDMGTGDLTIEGWFYLTATVAVDYRMIVSDATNGNNYVCIRGGGTGGQLEINVSGVSFRLNLNNTVVINTWFHLAVTRYNGTWYAFVNGLSLGTSASASAFNLGNGGMYIGRFGGATAYEWPGYIDDLRITKGIARYVTNFTPPTAAFLNK